MEQSQTDRRSRVDLTWPRHLERRVLLPPFELPDLPARDDTAGPRTLPEVQRDRARLQEAMDSRLLALQELTAEEFEAQQALDADVVTAWAMAVRRLDHELEQLHTSTD